MSSAAGIDPSGGNQMSLQNLHTLVVHGNWEEAKKIFTSDSNTKTAPLNSMGMTALHLAARFGKSQFLENLVSILTSEDLLIKDQLGRTALHYAASASKLKAVKTLAERNPDMVMVEEVDGYTPLFYASRWVNPSSRKEHKKVVKYLYHQTGHSVYNADTTKAANLISAITASGCYGTACVILEKYPKLALAVNENGWSLLRILASQPRMLLQAKKDSWRKSSYSMTKVHLRGDQEKYYYGDLVEVICVELRKKSFGEVMEYFFPSDKPGILQTAIIYQVPTLIRVCLRYFPDLIWHSSPFDHKLLLHVAVEYRDKEIFDLILEMTGENLGSFSGAIGDEEDNNILHLAAKMAPTAQLNKLPGPAFQLQRELQWFQKVETLVGIDERIARNKKGKTPVEVLFDDHSELLKNATKWMKDAAESGMLIAALVATVGFASLIDFPGGTSQETGRPVLYRTKEFKSFAIAGAVSMISSAVSLLIFLTIQNSKYRVEDFIASLPLKFLGALLSLFVAVVAMMLAFGIATGMAFYERFDWPYIPITVGACIPAIIFPFLQLPLVYKAVKSTITAGSDWSWNY